MPSLQIKSIDPQGVTYANPADPGHTVRFKFVSTPKTAGGLNLNNSAVEIIVNDDHTVTVGTASAKDALSIRIRASGAVESKERLEALLLKLAIDIPTWVSENVVTGFRPVTPPTL